MYLSKRKEWNGIKEETASVSFLLMLFLFLNSKFTHERRKEGFFFFKLHIKQGQWHLLFRGSNEPFNFKKKLLVYFMLKNIFTYIG